MDEHDHEVARARDAVRAARIVVKGQLRQLRTLNAVLADLDERLDVLDNAQPKEAQRDEQRSHEARSEEAHARSRPLRV